MNLAFFDATPHWSGGAKRLYLLCRELKNCNYNIHIICLPGSQIAIRAKKINISVHELKPITQFGLISLIRIILILKKEKIQLIDINSPKFYWLGLIAAKLIGIKIIITRNVPFRKKGIKKLINRLLYNSVDLIITISNYIKDVMIADYGKNLNIEVIYDGIDLKEFSGINIEKIRTQKRKEYKIFNKTVLGIIGRLDRIKGHKVAIQSLYLLKQKKYDVCLLIVGTGPKKIKNELVKLITNLNLEQDVIFTDFYDNIIEILSAIDIVLTPSFEEGLGMNIIEALALNKPVIASNVGGIPEIIKNGVNGILVKPGDAYELANAVESLINSGYKNLTQNTYEIIKNNFNIETTVLKYKNIYQKYFKNG